MLSAENAENNPATELFETMIKYLPRQTYRDENGYYIPWTDGEEILLGTENESIVFARFLKTALCERSVCNVLTGYYDPNEENEPDDHTGFWYVTIE